LFYSIKVQVLEYLNWITEKEKKEEQDKINKEILKSLALINNTLEEILKFQKEQAKKVNEAFFDWCKYSLETPEYSIINKILESLKKIEYRDKL
jgi:tRNA C32,U32 (ribose-2'-O)-methylase TrmJ